jgi:uncharacterized phage protein gp47/JayE
VQRADADLTAKAVDALRRSDQVVLARVHAGATSGLHGHIKWAADQILPDTCDEDMLLRIAKLRLKTPRGEAIASTGPVVLGGQATAVIDAGEILQTKDGRRYAVVATVEFVGVQATVTVTAVDPGKLGDVAVGESIELVSPVLGVSSSGVVGAGGIVGGTDQETIESLRARVIRSYQIVPQGGSADDYETWALEVTGITRAWCVRNYMGPGTVGLFVVRDGDANPIPPQAVLDLVKDHIESTRPVTAELYVLAPVAHPIAFRIKAMPDSTQTRAAIEAALRDLLKREGDLAVTVLHTHLAEAISQSPGENDHELQLPAANVVLAANEIPTFGGIEWV